MTTETTRRHRVLRPSALLFTCLLLAAFFAARAHADSGYVICQGGQGVDACQWGDGALPNPYIRQVPQPATAEERAAAAERERAWVERCLPVIEPDRFGVDRYHYSAAGCEFGR